MSTPQHVTKTRFAALLGVGKSYVSNLATQGRLVVNEQGLVDVEASKRLIAQTAGAPERGAVTTLQFSDARERKEHYLAEAARMDYEERCGHLLPADATVAAISAAAVTVRARFEGMAHQLAPQLAAERDENAVRAMLIEHHEAALADLAAAFAAVARAPAEGAARPAAA